MITGVMMINDAVDLTSYALFADACNTLSVVGCNVYSFSYGFLTTGPCKAVVTSSSTFVNCNTQLVYSSDTTVSRSFGHVCLNNAPNEWDQNGTNKMGWA